MTPRPTHQPSFPLAVLSLLIAAASALAEDQPKAKPHAPPIAVVLKRPVMAADLPLDPADKSPRHKQEAIATLIAPPLRENYIRRHRLEATPEEIAEFRNWLSSLPATDGRPALGPKPSADDIKAANEVGKASVEHWKFNRAIHKKYGGRVVFQQAGLEPVDGYLAWLRDEEKAGRFAIHNPEWKTAFWEHFTPHKHRHIVDVPKPFETPPWAETSEQPSDDSRKE